MASNRLNRHVNSKNPSIKHKYKMFIVFHKLYRATQKVEKICSIYKNDLDLALNDLGSKF